MSDKELEDIMIEKVKEYVDHRRYWLALSLLNSLNVLYDYAL